jgi:hypothetical protein
VTENTALRCILAPETEEVTAEWRELHAEKDEMGGDMQK